MCRRYLCQGADTTLLFGLRNIGYGSLKAVEGCFVPHEANSFDKGRGGRARSESFAPCRIWGIF